MRNADLEDEFEFLYGIDNDYFHAAKDRIRQLREKKGRGMLISLHQHNEENRIPKLLRAMKYGFRVAIVSEAGTPTVSDPGERLVEAAVKEGVGIEPLPGPSASLTALSASGFRSSKHVFEGYLPKTRSLRLERLLYLRKTGLTAVFFEN